MKKNLALLFACTVPWFPGCGESPLSPVPIDESEGFSPFQAGQERVTNTPSYEPLEDGLTDTWRGEIGPDDATQSSEVLPLDASESPEDKSDSLALEEALEEPEEEVEEPEEGCNPISSGVGLPLGDAPSFEVAVESPLPFLTDLKSQGFLFYPDGNLTVLGGPGNMEVFLPVGTQTMRLVGPSLESLSVSPGGAILSPTGDINTPHQGYIGANTILECNGERHAFFHGENHAITGLPTPAGSPPPYHATMNRATAPGGGVNFTVSADPCVVSSAGSPTYGLPKIAYGAGGGTVFDPGGPYLYLYYFDWDGSQGIHLARACREQCGAPGTWVKWTGNTFSSEANPAQFLSPSGPSEVLVPVSPGAFDAFSSISFNTYLNGYLMVSATEAGIAMRVSADGIQWGPRVMVLEFTESEDATLGQFYPTLLDNNTLSRDVTGRTVRLLYGWQSDEAGQSGPHTAWNATVELVKTGDAQLTSKDMLPLVRHYNGATGDHWVTPLETSPGYNVEATMGLIPANSVEGTHPLYDCLLEGNRISSRFTSCEGGISNGIMGFAWSDAAPGRIPLFRCFIELAGGGLDHFLSLDPQCEGATNEGIIGYIE